MQVVVTVVVWCSWDGVCHVCGTTSSPSPDGVWRLLAMILVAATRGSHVASSGHDSRRGER